MRFLLITIFLSFLAFEASAAKNIYIKIGDAQVKKSLIAIPSFHFLGNPRSNKTFKEVGSELFSTVYSDLEASSYFQFISSAAFIEDSSRLAPLPAPGDVNGFRFRNWQVIGAEFLVRADFNISGDEVLFETYSYFVPGSRMILTRKYRGSLNNVRRVAHQFTNDLVKELTGKESNFLSKVVLTSDRAGNQWREVYVMDWDGANMARLTNHRSVCVSPSWSPDGKSIAYSAYLYHPAQNSYNVDLVIYDLSKGSSYIASQRKGINSGSNWLPDGNNLFITISVEGTPNIYKIDRGGNILDRITTSGNGIMNVEPAISPDGKTIAFSSDRSGRPMIYTMNANKSNLRRLTNVGLYNANPVWSPDGSKIAFAGWEQSHFDIFIMDKNGRNMSRITSVKKSNGRWASNDQPAWSPDGRQLMFVSDRTGSKQLFLINADGTNERRITHDKFDYRQPQWTRN